MQELLGHSDVSTTMNVYAHSTRDAKRKSAMADIGTEAEQRKQFITETEHRIAELEQQVEKGLSLIHIFPFENVKNKIAATKSKIRYAASKIASITSGICGL